MEAAERVEPFPWMTAPTTRAVVDALTAEGAEVRFVGGCVRDSLLGRPVRDIDIATPDPPERVIRLLENAGIRAVPTGLDHGTVTAVADGAKFEITTLRVDVETDGRHARVAFTDDWRADAARRDFTVNALFLAPDGRLFDPFGGRADLARGRIRFVGDPETRIREDVLRLLRFFRFYATYGRPPPDPDALAACRRLAPLLPGLSGERVAGELFRLLVAPGAAATLALMREAGVLDAFLPEARRLDRLEALVAVEAEAGVAPDALRRLAAMLEGGAEAARAVAERLRLSRAERERLQRLAAPPTRLAADLDERATGLALYELGAGTVRDLVLLEWAQARASGTGSAEADSGWRSLLRAAGSWRKPAFPLGGDDVIALGVPEGPEVGRLLGAVERWWAEGGFRAGREACLARLRQLAKERNGGEAKTK